MFLRLRTDCKSSQKSTTSCQPGQVQRGTQLPAVACDSPLETTGIIALDLGRIMSIDKSAKTCLTNLHSDIRPYQWRRWECILLSRFKRGDLCGIPGVNVYRWVPTRKGLLYGMQLMSLCSGRVTVLKFQTRWAQQRPKGQLSIHGVVPFP